MMNWGFKLSIGIIMGLLPEIKLHQVVTELQDENLGWLGLVA